MKMILIAILLLTICKIYCNEINHDLNGYILYCPCMGRFGNQADHFLGVLGFAKKLNRTLVLPPWVEYRTGEAKSLQISFDTYFNVSAVNKFHRAILMEDFMKYLAKSQWPIQERMAFCYQARGGTDSCNAKDGNPFGPFWDHFNVDFVESVFYSPFNFDVYHSSMDYLWRQKYNPGNFPVLAFTGAPASFPVQIENKELQKYLIWNDEMIKKAKEFIKTKLPAGAFVGIHLRNGIDWVRACEYIPTSPNLFSAPQCLGYRNEKGNATHSMCLPAFELIVRQLKRVIRNGKDVKSVFVASDNDHMIPELSKALERMKIKVVKQEEDVSPHLDLAILGRSHYFIGNCISSFSAFVARERDVKGYPTYFWGFPPEKGSPSKKHDEL